MSSDAHWMERAFAKNKGGLHRATHTPEGQKIPERKIDMALHARDPHKRAMAQAAENAAGVRKRKEYGA